MVRVDGISIILRVFRRLRCCHGMLKGVQTVKDMRTDQGTNIQFATFGNQSSPHT